MKKIITVILGIILVFSLLFSYSIFYRSSAKEISITVTGKDRVIHGSGENAESKYLIYANGETFENVDSWTFFKFNSADFQGKLQPGKTYKVKVAGWRIPITNSFRNIVVIE